MNKHLILVIAAIFIAVLSVYSQGNRKGNRPSGPPNGGFIKVKVIDNVTEEAVEYANIVIYSVKDSSLVTGGVTNSKGIGIIKEVPFGKYYTEIDFIGYKKILKEGIELSKSKRFHDLGTVKLKQAAEMLEDVSVRADRNHIDYKIDKKVVNVSQDLTSAGGSAVDVLENVPSIQTDIEGNVQLRGSSSFTVLIDGKPTPLEGSEALQQIPSSSIENIEIITNPSAKFDPDGTAGIINIVMKDENKKGINGKFNLSYGSFNAFNGDFLVNARTDKFNFFVGGNYTDRLSRSESEMTRATFGNDSVSVSALEGEGSWRHKGYNARTGFDYFLTDNDIFTVSGELGSRGFERENLANYTEYYSETNEYPFSDAVSPYTYYLHDNGFDVESKYLSGDLNYQHKFNDEGHDIQAYVYYSDVIKDETGGFTKTYTNSEFETYSDSIRGKERSVEDGENSKFRAKVDYKFPFSEVGKFESGYQYRNRMGSSDYKYEIWESGAFVEDQSQFNDVDFNRQIHSAYATYTNSLAKFDFMLGLRAEYINRLFESNSLNNSWKYEKFDLFPSIHLSRKLPMEFQAQASYSMRTRRPRSWFLDPFLSKMDEYNYRKGNPDLAPAYIDSYELNIQKRFGKHFVSLEGFYRKTRDKFERITRVDENNSNILIHTFDNIGSDQSFGLELMGNLNLFSWWSLNVTGDIYQYTLDAIVDDLSSTKSTITYSGRLNSTFKIEKTNTRFQLRGMYRSPSVTAQGERGEFFTLNTAARQYFMDRRLSVMFSLNDILGTYRHERIKETDDFYTRHSFDMLSPTFRITVSYTLNDYERRKEEHEGVEVESGGMM